MGSLRAEPRTLNPATALDAPSREVLRALHADLVHINRLSLRPEPELAERFDVSPDGRRLTVTLRENLRFSDGYALRRRRCRVQLCGVPRREGRLSAA